VFPRFKVTTTSGFAYFFECQGGVHTLGSDGWTTIRFTELDAQPETLGSPPFTFGTAVNSASLRLYFPAGAAGFSVLDNFDISGTMIGKSGR
jgi:hypothetical protein